MNAFKAVFLLCAVLGASTATQYASNGQRGWASQSSPAGNGGAYGQTGVQQQAPIKQSWVTMATETPSSASYGMFSSAPANTQASGVPTTGVDSGSACAQQTACASTSQNQICTCITIPDAPQFPGAFGAPADGQLGAPSFAQQAVAPFAQQNSFAAPATQQIAQQQGTYSAPQQQALPQSQSSFINAGKAY